MLNKIQTAIVLASLQLARKKGCISDFVPHLYKAEGGEGLGIVDVHDEIEKIYEEVRCPAPASANDNIEVTLVQGVSGVYLDIAHPGGSPVASIELNLSGKDLSVFVHGYSEGCMDDDGDLIHTITEDWPNYGAPEKDVRLILPLLNGFTIRSNSEDYLAGDYVQICDATGAEVAYWNHEEWREDPIVVMGAILAKARELSCPD